MVEREVKNVGISSEPHGNKMQGGASFPSIGKEDTDDTIMRKSIIPASCDSWKLLHNSTWSVHPFSQGELFLRVRKMEYHSFPTSHKEDFWQWPGGTTDWWFKILGFIHISIGEKVCTWRSARFERRSLVAKRFLKAAQRRESNTGKTRMEFYAFYELFMDILVVFQSSQNRWVMYLSLAIGRSTYVIEDFHGTSSPYWEMDWFQKERKKKARQAVFLTPTNPLGNDPDEEPHDDYTVPQKILHVTRWKHNKNAVYCVRLSKAQDQGLEFWQTKSFAIMTYVTIPGDCIDRVNHRTEIEYFSNGLRRQGPHPGSRWSGIGKASSSSIPLLVPGPWKQGTKRKDQAGAQYVTYHSTEGDLAPGNGRRTTSNMDVDSYLGNKEVSTNALLTNEAVKEEITDEHESHWKNQNWFKQNLYPRRSGEGEDGSCQESSEAVFEMGNVELVELKTSRIVSKGTILCACGKHIRPDQVMIRRIKAVIEHSQSTLLPNVCDYCKGLQTLP